MCIRDRIGLLVNRLVAWILSRAEQSLNTRAALLHVMGDVLGSLAAIAAGSVIWFTGWTPIDPLLSILIAGLILFSSCLLYKSPSPRERPRSRMPSSA